HVLAHDLVITDLRRGEGIPGVSGVLRMSCVGPEFLDGLPRAPVAALARKILDDARAALGAIDGGNRGHRILTLALFDLRVVEQIEANVMADVTDTGTHAHVQATPSRRSRLSLC